MATTYNGYNLIGYLGGRGIYRHPTRGLSIKKDHAYLVGMTKEEEDAWDAQLFDMAMIARIENERLRTDQMFAAFQEAGPCLQAH